MKFSGISPAFCAVIVSFAFLAGCSQTGGLDDGFGVKSAIAKVAPGAGSAASTRGKRYRASERERACLARAMFFESNRSSRDGLVAVGSVVMNRRDAGRWGNDVCSVVGAKRQFAPGVLSRPMNSRALPDVMDAADAVLAGERHPKVHDNVMFFHTAGLKFPYKNMHYTVVAGGNHFYEKRSRMRPMRNMLPVETVEPAVMVATRADGGIAPAGTGEAIAATPADTSTPMTATAFVTPDAAPTPTLLARIEDPQPEQMALAAQPRLAARTADATRQKPRRLTRRSDAADPVVTSKSPRAVAVAFAAPASARFGGQAEPMKAQMDGGFDADFDTAEPTMAFGASDAQATAVGELIVQQLGQ